MARRNEHEERELADWLAGFHSCALTAYVTVWRETGCFPPDSEAVRKLAYRLYEEELAARRS